MGHKKSGDTLEELNYFIIVFLSHNSVDRIIVSTVVTAICITVCTIVYIFCRSSNINYRLFIWCRKYGVYCYNTLLF